MVYASDSKLSRELKNNIKIKVGQEVMSYWSKQNFECFDPNTIFEFLGQFTIWSEYYFFWKSVDNFEIEHKTS